jgi:hypothetical protein
MTSNVPTKIDLQAMAAQEEEAQQAYRHRVMCCASMGLSYHGRGRYSPDAGAKRCGKGLNKEVQVVPSGCLGLCSRRPLVEVKEEDEAALYHGITPHKELLSLNHRSPRGA